MYGSGAPTGVAKSPAREKSSREHLRDEISKMFPQMSKDELDRALENYAPNGLTIKDEERLRVLENEHEERLKQAKIEKFKSLPKAIREKIVLDIETKRAHCEIDQLSLEPDDELKKLYKKDNRYHGANDLRKSGSAQHFYGIDDDKILEAHAETLLLEDDSGQEK